MTEQWTTADDRAFLAWEKRRADREPRPRVPLPEQLAARQHERDLAEERRSRSERWTNRLIGAWALIGAVALAAVVWWRAGA